jgi:hypothetical protein
MSNIHAEFIMPLRGQENFNDLRLALLEREENIDRNRLNESQNAVIDKLLDSGVTTLVDVQALYEMAVHIDKMWKPKTNLKVYFLDGNAETKEKVLRYASEWGDHCTISFSQTTDVNESDIRISFALQGYWSVLGTDAKLIDKSKPTMNLGAIDLVDEREIKATVLHEFGHAIGLIHEHQSPAITIPWNRPYVYLWYETFYRLPPEWVNRNVFLEFERTRTKYTKVDPLSIMGYHIPPEFTTNDTAFTKNYDLSEIDKAFIGQIYN